MYQSVKLNCLYNQDEVLELSNPTLESYKEAIKNFQVPVEPVGFDYQVKPYVDADPIKSLDYTDEEWDADILKNKHLILTCFPDTDLTVEDIYCTKRKYQKKDGVKCSVHYTVDKVRISYSNCMRTFEKIIHEIEDFDGGVYTKKRHLTSIYSNKKIDTKTKKNITLPMFLPDGDYDITKNLITYIEEDFIDWDLNFPRKKKTVLEACDEYIEKYGQDEEISEYDIKKTLSYLKKVCYDLDVKKQLDKYDDWIKVMFAIINTCASKKIKNAECRKLLHEISMRSRCYEEDDVDKWINNNIDKAELRDKRLGLNYLINTCIKNDDPELWEKYYEKPSYNVVKKRFESHCFKCLHNVIYIDMNEKINDINPEVFYILSPEVLIKKFSHLNYYEKTCNKKGEWEIKKKKFITEWIGDNALRLYQSVCFRPAGLESQYSDTYFNMFKGFRASLMSSKKNYDIIQPFLQHIKVVLMCGNEEYYDWFLQYLANLVQHPDKKSNVIIVFQGTQGSGKSIVVDTIVDKIIGGDYAISTSNPERTFFGTFNSLLSNKILSVINEASNELRKCMDRIKDLCVIDRINIEYKGKDCLSFNNYNNFIATTNNPNPFDVEWDDRRFAWFKTSTAFVGNKKYFNELGMTLVNEDFDSSLYNYLKEEVKITIDNFQLTRPLTTEYSKVKQRNLPNPIKFLRSLDIKYKKGRKNDDLIYVVSRIELYTKYKKYCEENKYTSYNEGAFKAYLEQDTGIIYCKSHGVMCYKFNKDEYEKYLSQYNIIDVDNITDITDEVDMYATDEE
jgi:hypothetical protein